MAHMVFCTKYKAELEGLDEPPFDSDFGQKIYKNVSKKAWGEWVERQKMLLNEYRLQPWTREAQDFLVEQMNGFFFGEGEGGALPKEYVAPTPLEDLRRSSRRDVRRERRSAARVHLTLADTPAAALLDESGGARNTSRDVAQPGRAHPWGG